MATETQSTIETMTQEGKGRSLSGKRALITGASSGIGEAIAIALSSEGADVVVAGRNEQRTTAVRDTLRDTGAVASAVFGDLGTREGVQQLLDQVQSIGEIDIVVNNAGIYRFLPTADTDEVLISEVLATNVTAPFLVAKALLPGMAERGFGRLINLSSVSAQLGAPISALYGASKAAVDAFTRAWAAEFGGPDVTINSVAPGPTLTPGTAPMSEMLSAMTAAFPVGRPADPAEVAAVVQFLASPSASYVNGVTLNVDGGAAVTLR